jgi:SAM-dependent methyltransferase
MNWKGKAAIQGLLSVVPGGRWVNHRLQLTFGDLRDLERHFDIKLNTDWRLQMSYLDECGISMHGLRLLEAGTGWFPALPLAYTLGGAREVRTYDINRNLSAELTLRLVAYLEKQLETIAHLSRRAPAEVERDYGKIRDAKTLESLLKAARIIYVAPGDAAATGLPGAGIDLAYSNSVLEHIAQDDIERILEESARILAPNGAILHAVACCDHYAFADRTITFLNYLQYDEISWRKWNNPLQYQNRLRASDFVRLIEAAGFRMVVQHPHRDREALARLDEIKLAPEFQKYSREDWTVTSLGFVARLTEKSDTPQTEIVDGHG